MNRPRILVGRAATPAVAERAEREFEATLADHDLDAAEAIAAAEACGAEGMMIGPSARLDARRVAALPAGVRIVATGSVGFDHIDLAAARARGIAVTNTPDVLTDDTADFAVLLILAACRRAHEYDALMRAGWERVFGFDEMLGVSPSGRALGIVGMGRIGQAVARRARAFGMRVLYHNRSRLPPEREEGAEYVASLAELLPRSQILSLHLPGGAGRDGMMDAAAFAKLPRGAVFVNTARGSLVDEGALVDALRSGHLFAAGLDVFSREPDFDRRLAELPNVFLAPHMASATTETRDAMGHRALDNLAAVLSGRPPLDPV